MLRGIGRAVVQLAAAAETDAARAFVVWRPVARQ